MRSGALSFIECDNSDSLSMTMESEGSIPFALARESRGDSQDQMDGVVKMEKQKKENSFGCDNCKFLKGKRCTMWEIKIADPSDSHCVSGKRKE